MNATRVLPESFVLYRHFDEAKYRRAAWAVILLGLLAFTVCLDLLNNLAGMVRPEYRPIERLHFKVTLERLVILARLLVPIAVVLVVHEGIHAICLWLFTHERPTFVTTFGNGGGIGVRAPSWYLSRSAFLVANLAPVCLMTLVGLCLLPIVSHTGVSLLVFCLSLNLAGSIADVASSVYVYLHPPSVYITTDGWIYCHHRPESVARWKDQLRSAMEWVLARLEQSDGE
jgi:hypothetical protein